MVDLSVGAFVATVFGAICTFVGLLSLIFQVARIRKLSEPWRKAKQLDYGRWQHHVLGESSSSSIVKVPDLRQISDLATGQVRFEPRLASSLRGPSGQKNTISLQKRVRRSFAIRGRQADISSDGQQKEVPCWVGFIDAFHLSTKIPFVEASQQSNGIPSAEIDGRSLLTLLACIGCEGPTTSLAVFPTYDSWVYPFGAIRTRQESGKFYVRFEASDNHAESDVRLNDCKEVYAQACGVFNLNTEKSYVHASTSSHKVRRTIYICNLQDEPAPKGTIRCQGDLNFTPLASEWQYLDSFRPQMMLQPLSRHVREESDRDAKSLASYSFSLAQDHGGFYSSLSIDKESEDLLNEAALNLEVENRAFVSSELARILLGGACAQQVQKLQEVSARSKKTDALSDGAQCSRGESSVAVESQMPSQDKLKMDIQKYAKKPFQKTTEWRPSDNSILSAAYTKATGKLESRSYRSKKLELMCWKIKYLWVVSGWTTRLPLRMRKYPSTLWLEGALQPSKSTSGSV